VTQSPMPFEVADAAYDELGVDAIVEERDEAVAALTAVTNIGLHALADHPARHAVNAADELLYATREAEETGYLPEDNMKRGVEHVERYAASKRKTHAERVERDGIGRGRV
jgi:hypothetical protein